MVISLLPDEGPSVRVETLFSKTFAGVSDSRVNYYYYYYYYLKEEREASTYEAKKCQSPPGIEPGTCGLHDYCSTA